MPFLIIFVLIPLAEVYAFIEVGGEIGILQTLLLCVLTAAIGGFLVRQQGLETLFKTQTNLQSGKIPLDALFDGFCIVVAGALLLTPGFVTDIIGFSLLFPPFRQFMRKLIGKYGNFQVHSAQNHTQKPQNGDIIEGEYVEINKDKEKLDQ